MDRISFDVVFPRDFRLQIANVRPEREINLDILALSIEAKQAFEEYQKRPLEEIFKIFKGVVAGDSFNRGGFNGS